MCRVRSSPLHRGRVDVPIQRGHHRRVHPHTGLPPTLNVSAHDELDWLGHYLLEGLYFADVREGRLDGQNLLSYSTGFDDYYAYVAGERTTEVDKPRQAMPEAMRQLMERLEREGPAGFVEACVTLLEGDTKARETISAGLVRSRARAIEIGAAGFRIFIGDRALAFLAVADAVGTSLEDYVVSARLVRGVTTVVGIRESIATPTPSLEVRVRTFGSTLTGEEQAQAATAAAQMRSRVQRGPGRSRDLRGRRRL